MVLNHKMLILKKSIGKLYNRLTLLIITISLVTLITINSTMNDSLASENITNKTQTLSELFKKVEKSVVQISSEDETTTELLGTSILASGFVYDTDGHIITTNDVTAGGQDLHITFSDGTIYTGKIIGSDPH